MRRGIVGILLLGAVAVVAGLIGYQAGTSAGAAAAGATVIVAGGFPWAGFLFLTFLILFVGLPFFAFAGMRRAAGHGHGGHGGRGGPWMRGGPGGPWEQGVPGPDDPRRQWVAEMHRKLHEADAAAAGRSAASGGTPGADAQAAAPTGGTAPGTAGA